MKELILHGKKIITGAGSIKYIETLKDKRVVIVTGGQSAFENGSIDRIKVMLEIGNSEHFIISGISKNPTTDMVTQGVSKMLEFKPDTIIAIGGGSPIDAAKVMAVFYENQDLSFDNIGEKQIPSQREIEFIAIPTTSGTATEVTKAAVITYKEIDLKIGLKSPAFIPDVAILDSDLTMSMPDFVVAETGMDAMTHAVESYINKNLDDYTEIIARGAVEGLFQYLPSSYKEKDALSRGKVHNYQCLAGMAFSNVGLGMAHGISHAIGGMFNYGHGLINAVVLPYVLQFNSKDEQVKEKIKKLGDAVKVDDFIGAIKELNDTLNIAKSFKEMGIGQDEFDSNFQILVENSLKGSTVRNPIKVDKNQMEYILKSIYEGKNIK